MKKIINGVTYNTATSTIVATASYDNISDGGTRGAQALYQTRGGAFFVHDHEVIAYRGRDGDRQERETDTFEPMSRDRAHEWVMTGEVELHSDVFGEPPEASADTAPEATIYARVPSSLKATIEQRATAEKLSVNAYVTRCLEQCARSGIGG